MRNPWPGTNGIFTPQIAVTDYYKDIPSIVTWEITGGVRERSSGCGMGEGERKEEENEPKDS